MKTRQDCCIAGGQLIKCTIIGERNLFGIWKQYRCAYKSGKYREGVLMYTTQEVAWISAKDVIIDKNNETVGELNK